MNPLQGDELRRCADRHAITKPEPANAIRRLQGLQGEGERHFRAEYLPQPRPGAAT